MESDDLPENPQYLATIERLAKIKRVTATGVDYWLAREICPVLGYTWEGFNAVLERAKSACSGVGAEPANHFRQTSTKVKLGSGAQREVSDLFLSRTACYLLAMNGEPSKPEVAAAQAYFAVQTRRMEQRDEADAQIAHDQRRLELRGRVTESFKKVSGIAKAAGVRGSSQGIFHDARYRGLYNASLREIRTKKGLGDKENLMDRAGPLELSANDFQMELAAKVIETESVRGEQQAINRNREVAQRVRRVIEESGSTLPEDLPLEPQTIKVIEARVKKVKKLSAPKA